MEKSNIILFGAITFVLLSMVIVSAIYPGEIYIKDLSSEMDLYLNHSIKGNTSAINISLDNLIATIIIPIDYTPGDFEIVFYGYKGDKIIETVEVPGETIYRGGGGSSKTIYKNNTITKTITKDVPGETIQKQ